MSLSSINDKMDEATQDASEDHYILATVVSNTDPDGINRIQVDAPGIFDSHNGEVPMIGSHTYSPFGIGPTWGVYGSPYVGSVVKVKLQGGDTNQGQYEASAYPKSFANPKFASPMTYGYKDPKGNELFVNLETGAWEWTHFSGFKQAYDGSGNLTVTAPANMTENIQGALNITVHGATTLNAQGGLTANVTGDANVTASGNVNIRGATINLN